MQTYALIIFFKYTGFQPTNLCSLRTIKADLICGLLEGQSKSLEKENNEWMITGEFGTIQFAAKCDCFHNSDR